MASIAYITDSKMLEYHRLHACKTMNFWRLSSHLNFSDFSIGDLIFFLSKDKRHTKNREKGIVGYGKVSSLHLNRPSYLWKKFKEENGYQNYDEFKEAICRFSKNHSLPDKMSSFYLENVTFFQEPIYLSECGMKISNKVESYIYLNPEVVVALLDFARKTPDLWSADGTEKIKEDAIIFSLSEAHKRIGDLPVEEKKDKKIFRFLSSYQKDHPEFSFIRGSKHVLFTLRGNLIHLLIYKDKDIDDRIIIGQCLLYRYHLKQICKGELNIRFSTTAQEEDLDKMINGYLKGELYV